MIQSRILLLLLWKHDSSADLLSRKYNGSAKITTNQYALTDSRSVIPGGKKKHEGKGKC
jgi:hypothetical protein